MKTNVFMIMAGRDIYVGKDNVPWMCFQLFVPGRKLDYLFGAN